MIARREVLLAAGSAGATLFAAAPARACSIVGTRLARFSDKDCRKALQQWVDLLNRAPEMSREAIGQEVDELGFSINDEMVEAALSDTEQQADKSYLFYQRFRLSDGKLDTKPARLREVNLIRRLENKATYQFTLDRYSYHAADLEGCNGMFTHDESWGTARVSYLATFTNNRLNSVRMFPEWYLEDRRV